MARRAASRKSTLSLLHTAARRCNIASADAVSDTIGVDGQPCGVGVNPKTGRVCVTSLASGVVSVMDGTMHRIAAIVGVGDEPMGVGVNPVTNILYVANSQSNTVSVVR